MTIAEAAQAQRVDRSTVLRIRQVAKDGASATLAASKLGVAGKARAAELEAAPAQVARLYRISPPNSPAASKAETTTDPGCSSSAAG